MLPYAIRAVRCCLVLGLAMCAGLATAEGNAPSEVDLGAMVKTRLYSGVPGMRMANGKHKVVFTSIVLGNLSDDEMEVPYWTVRKLKPDDEAKLNDTQLQVIRRIQQATAAWVEIRQHLVAADERVAAAEQDVKNADARRASAKKVAERENRQITDRNQNSLDAIYDTARRRLHEAEDNRNRVIAEDDGEERRLWRRLQSEWQPVLQAFRQEPTAVDLDALKDQVRTPDSAKNAEDGLLNTQKQE